MSTAMTKFGGASLPSAAELSALATGLKAAPKATPVGGTLLKMDRNGNWLYGADQTDIEEDSLWAVNPFSFVHGVVAWSSGQPIAEDLVPMTQPKPVPGPAPQSNDPQYKGWEAAVGCTLACINGEDDGVQVDYKVNSDGGRRAVGALVEKVAQQLERNPEFPVAIVSLGSESYRHKRYGEVHKPVIAVIDWADLKGKRLSEEGQTKRVTRQTAAAPQVTEQDMGDEEPTDEELVEAVEQQAAPEPAAEEPVRRRRRPARA